MTVTAATALLKTALCDGNTPLANKIRRDFQQQKGMRTKSPYPVPYEWRDWVRLCYYLTVQGDKRLAGE